jgi:hypothetical protein
MIINVFQIPFVDVKITNQILRSRRETAMEKIQENKKGSKYLLFIYLIDEFCRVGNSK